MIYRYILKCCTQIKIYLSENKSEAKLSEVTRDFTVIRAESQTQTADFYLSSYWVKVSQNAGEKYFISQRNMDEVYPLKRIHFSIISVNKRLRLKVMHCRVPWVPEKRVWRAQVGGKTNLFWLEFTAAKNMLTSLKRWGHAIVGDITLERKYWPNKYMGTKQTFWIPRNTMWDKSCSSSSPCRDSWVI